jgi:hypothetical protein
MKDNGKLALPVQALGSALLGHTEDMGNKEVVMVWILNVPRKFKC